MDYQNPDAIHHNMRVDPNGIHRNITEYVDSLQNLKSWAANVAKDDRAKTLPNQSDDYARFWDNVAFAIMETIHNLNTLTEEYRLSRTCQSYFHYNRQTVKCTNEPDHKGWHRAHLNGSLVEWGMTP